MFILILSLLSALSAQAKLTTLCEVTTSKGDSHTFDSVELPLEFKPYERNEYISQQSFTLPAVPGFKTTVQVIESLDNNSVRWFTQISFVRLANNNIVARSQRTLEHELDGRNVLVICGSFDKTVANAAPPAPGDVRESARMNMLGGYGPVRAYGEKDTEGYDVTRADLYDLFLQVMNDNSKHGAMFRATIEALIKKGMKVKFFTEADTTSQNTGGRLHTEAQCEIGGAGYTCDVEQVDMDFAITGKFIDGANQTVDDEFWVKAVVTIYRDSKTRLIRGYRIESFRLDMPERGGNSSSSGGRVRS